MTDTVFIGVDVGTGSARAGVFDASGTMLGSAKRDIRTWREPGDLVEQSSDDIWAAVCDAVRRAVAEAGVAAEQVGGIGFDATCSLVAIGADGRPVAVGAHGDPARNVIVWMDHRAVDQARRINAGGHAVLSYVGGVISPEMETPKLLWLKERLPAAFDAARHFFDLPDYLSWRASGGLARSACTVTCKWTYLAHENRWDEAYFRAIGLGALAEEGFARIGTEVVSPGAALGGGLTEAAARELGLKVGTTVAAALIDAHAGGLGTVGAASPDGAAADPTKRLAYIFGTSACAMATTPEPVFVPGVWGPYFSAMLPGFWLNEGGQSAAGAALDHLLTLHPGHAEATADAKAAGLSLLGLLEREAGAAGGEAAELARGLHVVPEFLGNRSPGADPDSRGAILGLDLDDDRASLVRLYVAGLCGLAYGARQIIAAMREAGAAVDEIVVSGGAAASPLARQLLADATGASVSTVTAAEPVLLGSAMLAATAAGRYAGLAEAMSAMSRLGVVHTPSRNTAALHAAKFKVFEAMQALDRQARELVGAP